MIKRKVSQLILLVAVMTLLASNIAAAATPPDVIHEMAVTITPQADGSLRIDYAMDYEATTDFPADIQYLEVGVPNSNFRLERYSPPDLISGGYEKKGGVSQVHLDFIKLPKAGDRFKLDFTIIQDSMIYEAGNEVVFQFRPGWFDFAVIEVLKVTIDTSSLWGVTLKPKPDELDGSRAVWITRNMKANQQAEMITVTCARSSYPNLKSSSIRTASSAGSGDSSETSSILLILGFIILLFVLSILAKSRSYRRGRYGGGYRRHHPIHHHTHHHTFVRGGSGRGGGGGGCAHACACACACAGGGRVGCSERGYDVTCWLVREQPE
jgi:hypothetical protein